MITSPPIQSVHGRIRSITGTDPAAGDEILETVPDRRRWLLHSLSISLSTDVTAVTRYIHLFIDDGTTTLFYYRFATSQAASLIYAYYLLPFTIAEFISDIRVYVPLPKLTLGPGYRIQTFTSNLQAGDNYIAPQLLVEEWIDP